MYSLRCWKIVLAVSVLTVIFTVEGRTQIAIAEMQGIKDSNLLKQGRANGDDKRTPSILYDAQGRREPFLPLVPTETNAQTAEFPQVLSPIQQPQLQIRGIMSGGQGYHAIIQGSKGERYFVETGSILPSEGLKVKVITDTQLVLERFGVDGEQKEHRFPQELVLSFRD